jgi:predicted small secreted protein
MKKQLITIAILTAAVSLTGCTVNINDETMSAAKDIAASVLDDTDIKVNGQSVDVSLDSDGNVSVSAGQKTAAKPGADLFGGYVIGDTAVKSQPDSNSETLITIPDATQITVKESGVSGWFMTVFQDQTGYIAAQSVKDIPPYDPALGGDNVLGGSVNADVKLMSGTHPYAEVLIEIP